MTPPTPTPTHKKTTSTEREHFRKKLEQAGLYKPHCCHQAVAELRLIQAEPVVPMRPPYAGKKPTDLRFLGPLIRSHLATLADGAYRITPEGTAWLAAITERGLA